jgi:hypothetical protein
MRSLILIEMMNASFFVVTISGALRKSARAQSNAFRPGDLPEAVCRVIDIGDQMMHLFVDPIKSVRKVFDMLEVASELMILRVMGYQL